MAEDNEKNTPKPPKEKKGFPLWVRFAAACTRHAFNPVTTMIILILVVALLVAAVIGGVHTVGVMQSKTTRLGLEDIGELVTQAGYYTKVQSLKNAKELWGFQIPFTKSKYIFSYDGVIKAGIDFAQVTWSVNEVTHTITVKLPEPVVLSNEIDEESLMIYDESSSIFTPLKLDNINDSRIEMKRTAEEDAIANGLLDNARTNAQMLIRGFLAGLYDMNVYTVEFTDL